MKRKFVSVTLAAAMAATMLAGCGGGDSAESGSGASTTSSGSTTITAQAGDSATGKTDLADASFDTSYQPKKDTYKIYCTYKNIHSWYDAIKERYRRGGSRYG